MTRLVLFVIAFTGQLFALPPPTLQLDPAFGMGGRVVRPLGTTDSSARKVLIQPDGKIIVAGLVHFGADNVRLARFHADGAPDTGFGSGGMVSTPLRADFLEAWHACALQGDGKIVVAGSLGPAAGQDLALARYESNGLLDTRFGTGGIATLDLGGSEMVNAVAIQGDGKIVAVGKSNVQHNEFDLAAARFDRKGRPDLTFAAGGKIVYNRNSSDVGSGVAFQRNGKILVGGRVGPFGGVLRLNTDGTVDTTFGSAGIALANGTSTGQDLAVQRDGRILSVGDGLVRFQSEGTLDTTFGTAGRMELFASFLSAATVLSNGSILVAGNSSTFLPGTDENFDTALLDTSGNVLARIGTDFNGHERGEAVAITAGGTIVAAGLVSVAGSPSAAGLARYISTP